MSWVSEQSSQSSLNISQLPHNGPLPGYLLHDILIDSQMSEYHTQMKSKHVFFPGYERMQQKLLMIAMVTQTSSKNHGLKFDGVYWMNRF